MNKLLWIGAALALLAGVVVSVAMHSGQSVSTPLLSSSTVRFEPAKPLTQFSFSETTNGLVLDANSVKGRWSLMFLGYTSCPDVCPTTLAKLTGLLPSLQQASKLPVDVWLVSVDPQRDVLAKLTAYTAHFLGTQAARAEHAQLFPFVRSLGLMYAINYADSAGFYLVDHSASIVLIDPNGQLAAMFKPEFAPGTVPTVNAEKLLSDFVAISNSWN